MKKNIATVLFKYINKNHNNEELLKDLNELQELYSNDKKEINKMIEKINDIISSTLLEIAFLDAISNAISEISADTTCDLSKYFARLIVIAPEPVPISKIFTPF